MQIKYSIFPLLLLAFFISTSELHCSVKGRDAFLTFNNRKRLFRIFKPPYLKVSKKYPLIIVLHGGGMNRRVAERKGFNELAIKEKFIVLYPEAIGKKWNNGRIDQTSKAYKEKIDDVGFISFLIKWMAENHPVDLSRVYVTGASNGGMMTYRLAIELSEKIAASAAVIANIPESILKFPRPKRAIPIMILNGTEDRWVPFYGGNIRFNGRKIIGTGKVLSTLKTALYFVKSNACSKKPILEKIPDKVKADGITVLKRTFAGGREDSEVILYQLNGAGHTWPGIKTPLVQWLLGPACLDIEATHLIWNFFKKHQRR
ncbi:alpha/beta hydrolase family esterase [Candidatus Riflebacteria bacterium]